LIASISSPVGFRLSDYQTMRDRVRTLLDRQHRKRTASTGSWIRWRGRAVPYLAHGLIAELDGLSAHGDEGYCAGWAW